MLAPRARHVYLEALRPPSGFSLDRAVGTTYSLDLETLLAVPLGFAMLDWEDERGALCRDPVALLHALRSCADRVTVFCQAGRIAAPTRHHPLFAHLEPMVVEASAPETGASFHPKTWLLRFVGDEGVVYRFICLSQNLTPDRSWDTILALEGELAVRENAISRNHPLGDFIAALPAFAQRPLSGPRRETVGTLADEVRRVKFTPPDPFEDLAFWPMGLGRQRRFPLDGRIDRLLIVSPFLSTGFLRKAGARGADNVLVSRSESLEPLDPELLERFKAVHVLDDAATEEETDETHADDVSAGSPPTHSARGLHAKLFVADQGWEASVWTGSANATDAAFTRNVEFMVQLRGKKSRVGIDAFLGGDQDSGFQAFLHPFSPGERTLLDPETEENEKRAEALRGYLASAGLRLRVEPAGDAFDLVLHTDGVGPSTLDDLRARCWPAAISTSMSRDLQILWREGRICFTGLTVHALSSFVAFEVVAGDGPRSVRIRFALNLPISGAPADRIDRVLHAVLSDRGRLVRYLLFLLARDEDLSGIVLMNLFADNDKQSDTSRLAPCIPLFEELLRALSRSPDKLNAVARLIADLKRTPEGADLLPDGFDEMWGAIWDARINDGGADE